LFSHPLWAPLMNRFPPVCLLAQGMVLRLCFPQQQVFFLAFNGLLPVIGNEQSAWVLLRPFFRGKPHTEFANDFFNRLAMIVDVMNFLDSKCRIRERRFL